MSDNINVFLSGDEAEDSDQINVTIGDDGDIIDAKFSAIGYRLHANTHYESGTDELDVGQLPVLSTIDLNGNDLVDDTDTIWDSSAGILNGSFLDSIPNSSLDNDSITINTLDGIVGGGSVTLGSIIQISVDVDDFIGSFLSNDGSNNIDVDIGRGLEDDGSGNIRVDEDVDFTFTQPIDFSAGLDTQGDITDGTQVIWDASVQEIPDSAFGSIDNSSLTNDSLTVSGGDGLKSGGVVSLGGTTTLDIEPADFAGLFLQDDGADNLEVLIGRGLEDDGSGNIRVDEDIDFTFTQAIDFSAGLDTQGDITDGVQVIWDESLQEIPDSALGSIDNATLTNDSLTVTAGDGLKSGGLVSLGGSTTLNIEPADFAGFGVEDDGSDNIRVNEDANFTWTNEHTFNGGVTVGSTVDLQNTYKIINSPAPTDSDDLARKGYVDGVAQGLNLKDSVVASPTVNIDLASATDPNPVDGVTLTDGQRVLLKEQTGATENGIYVATTATDPTTWVRSADADEDAEVTSGLFTFVEEGTTNGNSSFIVTTDDPITLGVTPITFAQFASAGEITAGDGLKKTGQTINVEPADFAGAFLSDDGADNLRVDIGRGLENDGSDNVRVDEDTDFTFTQPIDFSAGVDTQGDITDGAQVIWDTSAQEIPDSAMGSIDNATLTNDSVTITAGNALNGGGSVALGGTTTIDLGTVQNTDLANNSVTVTAGDGLKNGGSVALGSSVAIDVEPADFAGTFLSDDGVDNLAVDIGFGLENDGSGNIRFDEDANLSLTGTVQVPADTFDATEVDIGRGLEDDGTGAIQFDEDTAYTLTSILTASAGVETNGDITDGATLIYDSSLSQIEQDALENDSVTVAGNTVALGGSTGITLADLSAYDLASNDLVDGAQVIWDTSAQEIPDSSMGSIDNTTLANDSVTITAGNALTGGGSVALGGTTTIDLGTVQNSDLANSSITVNANDGLVGGGVTALGASVDLDIEPADFAGTFLSDDGADNLTVDLGTGVENDGSGNIRLDEDYSATWTTEQTFSAGIDLGANQDISTAGGGSDDISIFDSANAQDLAIFNEGGNVEIPNGSLIVGAGNPTAQGTAFQEYLEWQDRNGNGVNFRAFHWNTDDYLRLEGDSGPIARFYDNGNVDIPNGQLELTQSQDRKILMDTGVATSGYIDYTGGSQFQFGIGSTDYFRISTGGVDVLDVNLNLNDNSLVGVRDINTIDLGALKDEGGNNRLIWDFRTSGGRSELFEFTNRSETTVFEILDSGGVNINTGNLSMGSNLVTNLDAPSNPNDATRKAYVDGVAQGLNLKESVVASPTVNIDLASATDPNPVDGVTLSNGDRVLLKDQTDATENGIYIANTATDPTTWTRSADADEDSEVTSGLFTFVEEGTSNGNNSFIITTNDPITLGTTSITFAQFASAGEIIAGDGLSKTGNQIDVNFGTGVELNSDNVRLDEDYSATWTTEQTFSSGIDMAGSPIGEIQFLKANANTFRVATVGGGSGFVSLYDDNNAQDILVANEGGNVSIPNGDLNIQSGNISLPPSHSDDKIELFSGGAERIGTRSNTIVYFGNNHEFYKADGSTPLFSVDSNGDFFVPNGDVTSGDTNGALEIDERASIADAGKAQLSRDASPQGYAMIQDVTNDVSCMVYLGGGANTVEIIHDSGATTNFTTTEDNDGTTNIYYDATNSRYEINNETGASATYSLQIMKA